jgi:hypothetical protein
LGSHFCDSFELEYDEYKHKHKINPSPKTQIIYRTIIPFLRLTNPLMGHRFPTHLLRLLRLHLNPLNQQQLQQPLPNPPTAYFIPPTKHNLNESLHHTMGSSVLIGRKLESRVSETYASD